MFRPQRRPRLRRLQEQRTRRQRRILRVFVFLIPRVPSGAFAAIAPHAHARRGLAFPEEGRGGGWSVVFPEVGLFEGFFHVEACECEGADHFEGEEANDVDCVVVSFEVEVWGEVEEVAEAFG